MNTLPLLLCASSFVAALALPSMAFSAATVPVGPFHSIGLTGDAHVVIRYGTEQRVLLARGSTEFTHIVLDEPRSGSLEIEACRHVCRSDYAPVIEITTPELEGLAVKGDGKIEVDDTFPQQGTLAVAVSGDGSINAKGLRADSIHAAVNGDGQIISAPAAN